MQRFKRYTKRLLLTVVTIIVVLVCAVVYLISTESGLSFLTKQLNKLQPSGVTVESSSGRILGPLQINGFKRQADDGTISVNSFTLDWQSPALWRRTLTIQSARIDGVIVDLNPQPQTEPPLPSTEPFSLPESLSLPLTLTLKN